MGQRVRVSGRLGINDHLGDAGAVAEVDEHEPAVVTPGVDPAHERHVVAYIFFEQFSASMRLFL